jgi:hypothetical protein
VSGLEIECRTTAEAEAAIAAGDVPVLIGDVHLSVSANVRIICRGGKPHVVARGSSQPHVVAWESSQPHVVAWESSQPHVVAWESSQPHVVARGSSQPHVVAWESSQPHVVAWESSQPHVVAWESSQPHVVAKGCVQLHVRGAVAVIAAATVAILVSGGAPKIEGGGFIQRVDRSTPEKWCEYYGVEVRDGIALVGKLVRDDYRSYHGVTYAPGSTPVPEEWDPVVECGSGLHFSPVPVMAREFDLEGKRYLICPVALADMAVHPEGDYPHKCKASRVAEPLWEVDVKGEPLADSDKALRDAFYARHAGAAK